MRNKAFLIYQCIVFGFTSFSLNGQIDQYAKIANKVTITAETDSWLKVSVPFNIITHPRIESLRTSRPSTVEEAFNPEFVEDVKVKLYICFSNEFKKKALRSSKLIDSQFYQYYSGEIDFKTIKVDRNTKYANFMFPAAIAERDEFGSGYITPVGYAIEVHLEGVPVEMSNAIAFEKYRDENTLQKFKQLAEEKSEINKGVLVPAHHLFPTYFQKGSYLIPSISGN
jgi:hypothetical protein